MQITISITKGYDDGNTARLKCHTDIEDFEITITLDNGHKVRILPTDDGKSLKIHSSTGRLVIQPDVANQIVVSSEPF